ncbi:MAG: rod shape-determining protein RodA [Proteobacteria bacterium SG_bin7]|nr:MAG: rod shape-determining protein RodA [Proteobacteria bacterium SG_bin7]
MLTGLSVQERNFAKRVDWSFILYILALNFVGLINLYSATHGISGNYNRLFYGQLVWIAMGWIIFFALTFLNYDLLRRLSLPFYVINLFLLALVPFIGKSYYGAKRWLDLGISSYQPSETIKLALIFFLARYLSARSKPEGLGILDLMVPLLIIGIPFGLIAKQPDLGTALLIGFIGCSVLLFVGVRRYIVVLGLILSTMGAILAWNFALKDYQKNRIETFMDPGKDPRGTGYNSIQSKIAVGSGRILGKGFRKGTQSQLEFLPERHTDFIFSVLSEEHGFVGSVTTIGLFSILFLMGIRIASQAKDRFGVLMVVGCMSYLFGHMLINIGMVIGLLPIVGIPLPLLSYGGSSLFTTMVCLGITSSVSYRKFLF